MPMPLLMPALLCSAVLAAEPAASGPGLVSRLTPQPQRLSLQDGFFSLRRVSVAVSVPSGPEHDACRTILDEALRSAGVTLPVRQLGRESGNRFTFGAGCAVPPLPAAGHAREAYSLAVGPSGATAAAASPAGLLYAAQTLRQLLRIFAQQGHLPAMTIVDYPEFKTRGIYIEGGQERFGRIVDKEYLREQIRRLAEFKMNTLVIECYNLFPFPSFPACADSGTLSREDCRELIAEANRCHVTIVPSLQTSSTSRS